MNKILFLCLLGCLLSLCSCDDDPERIYATPVYVNFPNLFDVPAQGGEFRIQQTWDNDYIMVACDAKSAHLDKDGGRTMSPDTVQRHEITLVDKNGKEYAYPDRYTCSWFEIRKENVHEIVLTASPNQTGCGRDITIDVRDFYFKGMPTDIKITQKSE